ncbi:putative transcriptional regulator YdeE [Paenibacillus amylolyticus]|uniref:Transcriptional regulator YdeE n=1 Tax=Paenibacillus amylolyticus TaxID=1451 RepID=A0AAP5H6N2_PAEAM|nr:zinc ribbon domain-containing protein [Paenibacillus amylolyticus]MDR6726807.1 putative transcriptional regulator YdeE [Paenibacillus amylolyticus]
MNTTLCQSCGMPLTTPAQFGTEADGNVTREYCIYCYKEGQFEQPNIPLEGMIEMCTAILKEEGMDEESARSMLRNQLPYLKRWNGTIMRGTSASSGDDSNDTSTESNGLSGALLGLSEPVRYVTLPAKRLAGVSARTTNAIEISGKGCIQGLWNQYFSSDQLPAPEVARYGCYSDYTDGITGEYTILVGHEVNVDEVLPEDMDSVHLPPATYAVFTSRRGSMAEVVGEAWGAVWAWADQHKRTFTGDFELYDERSIDPENVQVDVYIAVQSMQ